MVPQQKIYHLIDMNKCEASKLTLNQMLDLVYLQWALLFYR